MAELKTKINAASVEDFLNKIADENRRKDWRELDWFQIGFSPRKQNLTLYGIGIAKYPEQLKKLGKHKTGKGCLYINSLDEINMDVLKDMIEKSVKTKKK